MYLFLSGKKIPSIGLNCPIDIMLLPLSLLSVASKNLFSKKRRKLFLSTFYFLIITSQIFITDVNAKDRKLNSWLNQSYEISQNEFIGIASERISNDPFDAAIRAKRKALLSAVESAGVVVTTHSALTQTNTLQKNYAEKMEFVSTKKILSQRVIGSFVSKGGFVWYRVVILVENEALLASVTGE